MMGYYDTTRELFADDAQEVKEILDALTGKTPRPELSDKAVITKLTRALYHVLIHMEGREKKQ